MQATDITGHRGEFFRVLQQTTQSQVAVMTIAPGHDAGPEEEHTGDQIIYVVERRSGGPGGQGGARSPCRHPDHDPVPDPPPRAESRRRAVVPAHGLYAAGVLTRPALDSRPRLGLEPWL